MAEQNDRDDLKTASVWGRYGPLACDECERHFLDNMPALLHASASVGIEHALTTDMALDAYFEAYHRENHA
jgi:uncharacterized radical SAM superfamily protein